MNEQTLTFFRALFPEPLDDPHRIRVWVIDKAGEEKTTYYFRTADEAAAACAHFGDRHVYCSVGTGPDLGPRQRGTAQEVTGLVGLFADIDVAGPAHNNKKQYPPTFEAAREPLDTFPPTALINSGNGLQSWWLFKEIDFIHSEDDRERLTLLATRFKRYLQYEYNSRGYDIDAVQDLARVLRVPGTFNVKTDPPKPVTIIEYEPQRRLNPSDVEEFLDRMGVPLEEPRGIRTDCRVVPGLRVIRSASISDSLLAYLMSVDAEFQKVWMRHRPDFKSQSEYDISIANFFLKNGFSDQETVDAMLMHRRLAGEKPKHPSYYPRTLMRVKENPTWGSASVSPEHVKEITGNDIQPPSNPEDVSDVIPAHAATVVQKGIAVSEAAALLKVPLARIVQMRLPQQTRYHVYVKGFSSVILFNSYAEFKNQKTFLERLEENLMDVLEPMSKRSWNRCVKLMLKAASVEHGVAESNYLSVAMNFVQTYLLNAAIFPNQEALKNSGRALFSPYLENDHILVSQTDVRNWARRNSPERLDSAEITSYFVALGCTVVDSEKSRWALPNKQFDPEQYRKASAEAKALNLGGMGIAL